MRMQLPEKVKQIIETIENAGYEAYAVGGCVRDSILGRQPDDWDITTSALPFQVKELFPITIDTGLQHGTVTILLGKETFEVTTYRLDGEYLDGRHPESVTFTPSLSEDLKRRDFTINAMAYNERTGLVDLFGGMDDMERKIIRCVGNPMERFSEDALRVMRAIRFSAQLGYSIEEQTKKAIEALSPNLQKVSAERIQVELTKLLLSPHPNYLRDAYKMGITKVFLPEFDEAMETAQNNPHHCYSVGEHILHTLEKVPAKKELRLTMLFHDLGKVRVKTTDEKGIDHFRTHQIVSKEMAEEIMKRLRYDNETIRKVKLLVENHDYGNGIIPNETFTRKTMAKVGKENFSFYIDVRKADVASQSDFERAKKEESIRLMEENAKKILLKEECVCLKDMALTGKDILSLGCEKGRKVGEVLDRLLAIVLEQPEKNEKEILLGEAKQILNQMDGEEKQV